MSDISDLSEISVFKIILDIVCLTVDSLISSIAAISLLIKPKATNLATSLSHTGKLDAKLIFLARPLILVQPV